VFAEEDQIAAQRQRLSAENTHAASAAGASVGSAPSPHDDSTGTTTRTVDALSSVANRAGRRKLASQNSLFDLANQRVVEELKNTDLEKLSPEEAKEMLADLRKRVI